MRRGRPSKGLDHIEKLEAEPELKERLRLVLATLTGETTVREAAEVLGLSETRIHELRYQALQGALEGIAPRPSGRPPRMLPEDGARVHELEEKVQRLEDTLRLAQIRTEIALTMPHLLRSQEDLPGREEKGGPMSRTQRRSIQRRDRRKRKSRQ